MARNRIIYASQSVWVNGEIMYRVQSLGTTTSFTSEDVFELGHLDIIDVVDDVPAVAVTMNTNDFGDVKTLAKLAQLPPVKAAMSATADSDTGNLISGGTYMHGVCIADFAVTCGNLTGVTLWAPVQGECDLGTLADNIDQTLFLDEVYINSLEFSYTTGANATENYGAETDNKMWLLNDGRFVTMDSFTMIGSETEVDLTVASGVTIPVLSTGNYAFLRKTTDGAPAATYYSTTLNTAVNYEVKNIADGDYSAAAHFGFDPLEADGIYTIAIPTNLTMATDDRLEFIYAADAYGTTGDYFTPLTTGANADVGALRQGQVEVYIVDPDLGSSYDNAWRLTGVTVSADLTREPLTELGHLGPYDRPLTLPVPITVTVDSTAGDLENWAKIAGQLDDYDDLSLDDIDLTDLMTKDNLILVVKVFEQTDEEAGGTGSSRKVNTDSAVGDTSFVDGALQAAYTLGDTENALKTIIVKNLKITDEGMTLDVGANATQTFGFRCNNDLFVVKGDVSFATAKDVVRNS